jgi:hypothetical protein
MFLDYWVLVKRYLFLNEMVGDSIIIMKSSLYLMGKKIFNHVGRKPSTHPP